MDNTGFDLLVPQMLIDDYPIGNRDLSANSELFRAQGVLRQFANPICPKSIRLTISLSVIGTVECWSRTNVFEAVLSRSVSACALIIVFWFIVRLHELMSLTPSVGLDPVKCAEHEH